MAISASHKKSRDVHEKHFRGKKMSEVILGSQDGLVNVLGIILGVASATNNVFIVLVAGLAATLAETISMAAVAYTSTKAERDYHAAERKLEEKEVRLEPEDETEEIREIYAKKGFRGNLLNNIVRVITSNKKVWIDTMMTEELNLPLKFDESPSKNGLIVFVSTLLGSLVPLAPFLLLPLGDAIIGSIIVSVAVLFVIGSVKAKLTTGNLFISGLELAVIGIAAALTGYFVGLWLGNIFGTNVAVLG